METYTTETSASSTLFIDFEDRRLIEQIGLALRVMETTSDPDAFSFAIAMLHDFSDRLDIVGSADDLVAIIGEVLIKRDQSPNDREHVLGALALFLNLVLAKMPSVADRDRQVNLELVDDFVSGETGTESPLLKGGETSDYDLSGTDKQGGKTRTKSSSNEQKARLVAEGHSQVRPRGKQLISAAVSKVLETSAVIALRHSGAMVDVSRVVGNTISLNGQIRDGKTKVRSLVDSTEGRVLLHQFTFWAKPGPR